jgi:hypothetical protein
MMSDRILLRTAAAVVVLALTLSLAHLLQPKRGAAAPAPVCGVERWAVKVLSDADAEQVDVGKSIRATVDELRTLPRPQGVGRRSDRIAPVEFRVYRIRARLHEAVIEGDRDIHLVVHDDDQEDTLIVEFPDLTCAPASSSLRVAAMRRARRSFLRFVQKCRGFVPSFASFTPLSGRATIVGVGFWDLKHGTPQCGRVPQDFELHPVLSFTRGRC